VSRLIKFSARRDSQISLLLFYYNFVIIGTSRGVIARTFNWIYPGLKDSNSFEELCLDPMDQKR
jgi:hypothetical protein